MKNIRTILVVISILLLVFLGGWISRRSSQAIINDPQVLGNTAGNLYNLGLFCEDGERIYFSNPNDDGALYSMDYTLSDFQKISPDKATYLNKTNAYIIYSRANNTKQMSTGEVLDFRTTGIYRIKKNGKQITLLYDNPSGLCQVYGNDLYYQHYNKSDGLKFYTTTLGIREGNKISDDAIIPASILDNTLYYAGVDSDHAIYAMDLSTQTTQTILEANCYQPMILDDYIYYLSIDDNYAIARVRADGSDKEVLVEERCSAYNITSDGHYIYYQVDAGDHNGIYFLDMQVGITTRLVSGDYNHLSIVSDYLFYHSFGSDYVFYSELGSTNTKQFLPPHLKKN